MVRLDTLDGSFIFYGLILSVMTARQCVWN